jgi:large subunit ribosomal protein L23
MIHRFVQRDLRPTSPERIFDVIQKVLLTEKTTYATQNRQYTFEVAKDSNKFEIARAVEHLFGVKVSAVNTISVHGKLKKFRGRLGQRSDRKKAIVTLAEGQTLEFSEGGLA